MRVAEITGEPILHGGQERFIANLIECNNDSDVVIDVITPHFCDNNHYRKLVEEKGGTVFELGLPFEPGKSRRLLLKPIYRFLSRERYDVVHVHSGSISALAYIAKAAHAAKVRNVIVHSHSTGLSSVKHSIIKIAFGKMLHDNANHYLACSYEAGQMKFPSAVVKKDLMVVNNGIKITDYKRDDNIRRKQRSLYGIPEDAYVIGHVGRFTYEKNHEFLISVFSQISKQNPYAYLLLVGDGELSDRIRQIACNNNLEEKVIFTGNVDNVQDYYQMMDVFVLPSLYEGFPFVALEAQAAGLPCVISAGVSESVRIGKNVNIIELDNEGWVSAIRNAGKMSIADNDELIKEAGYDINDPTKIIMDIYKS